MVFTLCREQIPIRVRKALGEAHLSQLPPTVPVYTQIHTHTPSTALADDQPAASGRRRHKSDSVALHLFKLDKAANYGDQKRVVRDNDIIIL